MAMLADRFSRRLIIALGMMGTSLAGIGVSLTQAFWQMVPFFVLMGFVGGTYHAPASSFIAQIVPSDKRGRVLGMHVTGGSASFFFTPAMALGLANLFQTWRASFFILAIPAMLVGILVYNSTEEHSGDVGAQAKETVALGQGPSEISSLGRGDQAQVSWAEIIRSIGIIACLAMVLQIAIGGVNSYLPLYMVDDHGISPRWAGLVVSLIAGAGVFGAPLGGALSDRLGRKQVILISLLLSGPLLFAVTRSPLGILLLLSLVAYGMSMSVRMPSMESLIADVVPVGRRTTALGVYFFMTMETAGFTTPIFGRLIDLYGLYVVFTCLSVGLCLVAAIALVFRKHI
jgi:FSR family fosmidomycin resistance protein-like MFS transporter